MDFSDIFTVGIERQNVGFSFWIWCIGGGLQSSSRGSGIGIRGGHIGAYQTGGFNNVKLFNSKEPNLPSNQMGNSKILVNTNQHRPIYPNSDRSKNKSFDSMNIMLLVPVPKGQDSSESVGYCNSPLYTEVTLGIYYGLRLGINFTEFADFLIGFTTIDLTEDDTKE